MDIVTFAGTGRHVAVGQSYVVATPWTGVAGACAQQGWLEQRPRTSDLRLPTPDPQRPSAPSRWVT